MKDFSVVKDITLSEYFEYKGWGKTRGKISEFANICDVSIAYISKLYNNQFISNNQTKTFNKVSDVVKRDGFNLMKGNTIECANHLIVRDNKALKEKVKKLEYENTLLKAQLKELEDFIRLAEKITHNNEYLKKTR